MQSNVNRSWRHIYDLVAHAATLDPAPYFLALQDPPLDLGSPDKPIGNYYLEYGNDVEGPGGEHKYFAATLYIRLAGNQEIKFHNVYDRIAGKTLDFGKLLQSDLTDGQSVLLGDYNLPWLGRRSVCRREMKMLSFLTKTAGMVCLNSSPTFMRGAQESTIDLVFVGKDYSGRVSYFAVTRPRGFATDHAVLHAILDVSVSQDTSTHHNFKQMDVKALRAEVASNLEADICPKDELENLQIHTVQKADKCAGLISGCVARATDTIVTDRRLRSERPTRRFVSSERYESAESMPNEARSFRASWLWPTKFGTSPRENRYLLT
ncbi:hypothetical protein CkaCkLH20_07197 [Colletotrichum karsti]|uniref:Endonuclease/exonuclease/phosphatase domain-containing protein n=1 Tax=Colletotrichum karsti TaxID=1095194 RepID=A0A9P6I415_9PEZI|nr:uncharacterized protein CkaCkLH20_07197 [Colletotrichum karsti]KAF9875377.1 hypothetical protein CkaCkLH20_07197 [Colletotrichum karsti]